jgi:hypothetical protein
MRGLSSGLISPTDWECNYGFEYVNMTDHVGKEAEDNALTSVQIQFTNSSNVALDIYAFLIYERETISVSTGQLIL